MGQIFCALVLFLVIFSIDATLARSNSEHDGTLCSEDHPLYPFIKLFNDIPEEWKSESNNSPKKKPVCFTRIVTTETDDDGNEINKFSSYEITFGIPKKYKNYLVQQKYLVDNDQEFVNYPYFEEYSEKGDIRTKNVIYVRCSKNYEEPNVTPKLEIVDPTDEDTSEINHDLDFMDDLGDICDEHLDTEALNSLPDYEVTLSPDLDNTRKNGEGLEITSDIPDITTTTKPTPTTTTTTTTTTTKTTTTTEAENSTSTEYATTIPPEDEEEPSVLSRMSGKVLSNITTEISTLLTTILKEMNVEYSGTTLPSTSSQNFTISIAGINENEGHTTRITTPLPVTVELATEKIENSEEFNKFIIQLKNLYSPNSEGECFSVNSRIKYGKCSEPIIPIRILTESELPKNVRLELEEDLQNNRDLDEIIVSGRKNCYLLKNLRHSECPTNHDDVATVLEIDDLPENPNDEPYFTIEFEKQCTTVSKQIDVIECPNYNDTLPHLKTEHLPNHVRFKHAPGGVDVHVDDIIVHSFSHCLLLKAMNDIECKGNPQIVLQEGEYPEDSSEDLKTTDAIHENDNLPTYRLGDYSLERISDVFPKSFELSEEIQETESALTTPCNSEEESEISTEEIDRTTRSIPLSTTLPPEFDKDLKNECDENDLNCLTDTIEKELEEFKTRRTLKPYNNINENIEENTTTPNPITTTLEPPTYIKEIKIPKSRKLSKLLKTIIEESTTDHLPQSFDLFKPDFLVKVACAEDIIKSSCFLVSKYIMRPTFDDHHDYNKIIDKNLLPVDAKIISTPNLNIFEVNETIYATSADEKFVLIKKKEIACPFNPSDAFFILDTGSCKTKDHNNVPEVKIMDSSTVKYQKGNKVYCFDFDNDMRLHRVKCPKNLTTIPVLSRPEDLKTLCRSQLKNKGQNEQMKLLRRLNIVTDYNQV